MVDICDKSLCTGCHACINICGQKAISMQPDSLGFLYPQIDASLCVDCGLCVKVCPVNHPPKAVYPAQVYAVQSADMADLMSSTSGGAASVFSQYMISQGGVVYGCSGSDITHICHKRIENHSDLHQLKGSKYVQSNIGSVFQQVRSDLKSGRKVLFIGTPCQTAAIRNYFPNDTHLFIVDLICHGVPSQRLLRESLPNDFTSLHVDHVEFRASTKYHFSAKNGISTVYSRPLNKDLYMKGFFTALFYRNSCYSCKFAQTARVGDLTLGDFWGVSLPEHTNEESKGISLCMINTESGKKLLKRISTNIKQFERPLSEAVTGNKQLSHPMPRTFRVRLFQWLYPKFGFHWGVRCAIPEIILKNRLVDILKGKSIKYIILNL